MAVRAWRGEPLAQLIASHGRGVEPYPLTEQLRSHGPLVRTPFVWASVDHEVYRELLRDNRFGATAPSDIEASRPLRTLLARSNPGVANPVEPPAMVIVNPPDHTRYRQLVARSFIPRAIETLDVRVGQVTQELIDRLASKPRPDLIADFAAQLPVAPSHCYSAEPIATRTFWPNPTVSTSPAPTPVTISRSPPAYTRA
jgi:cytochrome P450